MRLGKLLSAYRHENRLGVRALAKEIGISHATLSRVENDAACDSTTLAAILLWLIGSEKAMRKRA